MLTRRSILAGGGLAFTALVLPRRVRTAGILEIHMRNDAFRVKAWFEPIGVHIMPGQMVRWIPDAGVHATAAYHPNNAMHSLRIPEHATPLDSGLMTTKGAHFDVTFTVEGVYDYFCLPHEADGMVGRIVAGKPSGPGTLSFEYFKGKPGTAGWTPPAESLPWFIESVIVVPTRFWSPPRAPPQAMTAELGPVIGDASTASLAR